MAKYRILSIDGGGIRGLITARFLDRLGMDYFHTNDWLDQADLLAGTSTGALLALGLAVGKTPRQIYCLYRQKGSEIFQDCFWDDVMDIGNAIGAQYSGENLAKVLNQEFGQTTLGELAKKVTVPVFDLDNHDGVKPAATKPRQWKPKVFHNYRGSDSDAGYLIKDVLRYTCAAPTYFPSVDGYIDGGVYANNPSMVALAQAISKYNIPDERALLDEVVMLSIGTGQNLSFLEGRSHDWGYGQWAIPLTRVFMDGLMGVADYQVSQLLGPRYHRLQLTFKPEQDFGLDAVDKINDMCQIASTYPLSKTAEWIKRFWL